VVTKREANGVNQVAIEPEDEVGCTA